MKRFNFEHHAPALAEENLPVNIFARRRPTRTLKLAGSLVAALALTSACATSGGAGSDDDSETSSGQGNPEEFSFLVNAENTTIPSVLEALAADQCSAENDALPLEVETVPQTQLDQQLQLLAGQDALPVSFAAGNTPQLTAELDEAGQLLDFESTFEELGVMDRVNPAAVDTIKALYGGKFNVLPYEYNIEGFWYNTSVFEEQGIEVPTTWDELVDAATQLAEAGIQPLSASGEQGWPLTRLISGYLFRTLGPDAMQAVEDGDAKLTDPEYVEAAEQVAALGEAGYFGEGIGSIDYDTAINSFMAGDAAMLYMGSWVTGNFSNEELNKVGIENIGFFPFPEVEGGEGSAEQIPANVGLPMTFSAKQYNDEVGAWLKCIAENYGTVALEEANRVSGFVPEETPKLDPLTQIVQERVDGAQESVLWFEAQFGNEATTVSQTNAAPLVSGSQSPEEFMSKVQSAVEGS
jgi:raffinose/stachyose/melibiose transport system substrate-binding protein